VTEKGQKLEEENVDGGVTYDEDFETIGTMMEMAEPEKRTPDLTI